MAQYVTRSISFPEEILTKLDDQANNWHTDRSNAIRRIFMEWQQMRTLRAKQTAFLVDPTEPTPADDMRSTGSPELPEPA